MNIRLSVTSVFVLLSLLSAPRQGAADHHKADVGKPAGGEAAAWRFVLTSAATNQRARGFSLAASDVGLSGSWSVRAQTLRGGKQEGVELITIDNGTLQIVVIPTRGMGVLEVRGGDVRLGWDSPVKEVVHPQFVDLDSRGGLGWIDGFNEWMVRCGLEFAGHPGKDEFTTNTGDTGTMDLSLHGKIANIPASEVEVLVDKAAPHRIRVRGVVHERLFFGPKLKLVAEISTEPGADTFRIHDTVTNLGGGPQEFEVIYHGNFGAPILEKDAKVVVPVKKIAPMNAHAGREIPRYSMYMGPTPGFVEEVYLIHPYGDADGRTMALLHNADRSLGASVAFSTKELPYLTIWKNTTSVADGYVTGLEPGTCFPYNRKVERKFGRLPTLASGETRSFTLDFGVHQGEEAVDAVVGEIAAIQAGRKTEVQREPTPLD